MPNGVFDSLPGGSDLVVQAALAQESQLRVRDRVGTETHTVCVQLSYLVPGEAVRAIKLRSRVAGGCGDKEYRGREPIPGQHRIGVGVEVTVSVVEGDHHVALRGASLLAPGKMGNQLIEAKRCVAVFAQEFHVLSKYQGRGIYLVVGVPRGRPFSNTVVHQDWDTSC